MLDDWLMRNTPITKDDSSKLSDLRYYLGVQYKFYKQVCGLKSAEIKYLEHLRLLERNLRKNGVADDSLKNELRIIYQIIENTIELLENKLGIEAE